MLVKRGSEASFEVEATKSWRARRMRGVWNIFKMSSFLFSIGLISIASFKIIDVGIGISIVVLASFLSVRFSIRYLNACLPERIFLTLQLAYLHRKWSKNYVSQLRRINKIYIVKRGSVV